MSANTGRPLTRDFHPQLDLIEVPLEYADHELVRGKLFFCLPETFLDAVREKVGRDAFEPHLVRMEVAMWRACCGSFVGFWGNKPVSFPLLNQEPIALDQESAAFLALTAKQASTVATVGTQRLAKTNTSALGYAGWLMCTPQFRNEHQALFEEAHPFTREFGIPQFGSAAGTLPAELLGNALPVDAHHFVELFEKFFVRWRLEAMPAPYLPQPIRGQAPVSHLAALLGHMRHGGTTVFLSEVVPVPSRDELRQIAEDALGRASPPEHLQEWIGIVRSANPSRGAIDRYARLFKIQHLLRALYQRHGESLKRAKTKLERALASYLGVKVESIHRDLRFISDRLGTDWYLA